MTKQGMLSVGAAAADWVTLAFERGKGQHRDGEGGVKQV